MLRKHFIFWLIFTSMISCSKGPVSLDGIKPNLESKIVVFTDTFMLYDILDLSGNELSPNGDSIFLIQSILDTSYSGKALVNFQDSTYSISAFSAINSAPISFTLDTVHELRSLSQINLISLYDPTNYSGLSGQDGDTVDSYNGFNSVTPASQIVPPVLVAAVDSASVLDTVRLQSSVVNTLNFPVKGDYKLSTAGQVIFSKYIDLDVGETYEVDTILNGNVLGNKIKVLFDSVTSIGFTSPTLWSNSNQLTFEVTLSSASITHGVIYPKNSRVFIGGSAINIPVTTRQGDYELFVCSGRLDAQYTLHGLDGPFYLIREVTDSSGFSFLDSNIMVQSPNPFTRNIMFHNDSLDIRQGKIYSNYYVRPLHGFPVRIKPFGTIDVAYGGQNPWNNCYFEGQVDNSLRMFKRINNSGNPNYSHLMDSLNLSSSEVVVNLTGNGIGQLEIQDSSYVSYTLGEAAYGDSIYWNRGSQLIDFGLKNNVTRIRPLISIDSSFVGALPTSMESEVLVTAHSNTGVALQELQYVRTGIKRLLGYSEGRMGYTAETELTINTNGTLDSLIFGADSVAISFEGDAVAQFNTSSELFLSLHDQQGERLVYFEGQLNYNAEGWTTDEFTIENKHLTGEKLKLSFTGYIGELGQSYVGMNDHLTMRIKLSFY